MRTEDIVGLSFFLVLFAGTGTFLYAMSRPEGSRERRSWLGVGFAVMGVAFLGFAVAQAYFIHTSARPVVEGNIWAVSEPVRGSSPGFRITDGSGRATAIRCSYDGPGLREGDKARVRYVAYNLKLVELTMLTGSYTGWHLEEPSGERDSLFWGLVGFSCGFAGLRMLRQPSSREPRAS